MKEPEYKINHCPQKCKCAYSVVCNQGLVFYYQSQVFYNNQSVNCTHPPSNTGKMQLLAIICLFTVSVFSEITEPNQEISNSSTEKLGLFQNLKTYIDNEEDQSKCVDRYDECRYNLGLCKYDEYKISYCQKTCGTCRMKEKEESSDQDSEDNDDESVCEDKFENCGYDLCSFEEFSSVWCRKSCEICTTNEEEEEFSDEEGSDDESICEDKHSSCLNDFCKHERFSSVWCRKSCNYCKSKKEHKCKDKIKSCSKSYCRNTDVAKNYCKHFCQLCEID